VRLIGVRSVIMRKLWAFNEKYRKLESLTLNCIDRRSELHDFVFVICHHFFSDFSKSGIRKGVPRIGRHPFELNYSSAS
jgi:hypothetical protein